MVLRFFTLAIFLVSAISSVDAQQIVKLHGKVTSYEGRPLFNISISVMNNKYKAWHIAKTDSSGNFVLPEVLSGDTLLFAGVQIGNHKEIIRGNNFIQIRIPTRRIEIAGAEIEAAVERSVNTNSIRQREYKWQEGFTNYDIIEARPKVNY